MAEARLVDQLGAAPWRSGRSHPALGATRQAAGAAEQPRVEAPAFERARRVDAVLRTIRARPWSPIETIVIASGMTPNEAQGVLDELVRQHLIQELQDPPRWALLGAKKPTKKHRKAGLLSPAATLMLQLVKDEPWHSATHYFHRMRDAGQHGARYASYSVLETLGRRGLLQAALVQGIRHWGPVDMPAPSGHMLIDPAIKSPRRRGGPERVLALLDAVPWQSTGEVARKLGIGEKGADNLLRELERQSLLQKTTVPGAMKAQLVYAKPGATPPGPEALERISRVTAARLPEHYGKNRAAVLDALRRTPWITAEEVGTAAGIRIAQSYAALKSLLKEGTIVRVADGQYLFALAGTPPPRHFSGILRVGRSPGKKTDRDRVLEHLQATPRPLTLVDLMAALGKAASTQAVLHRILKTLVEEGCVRSSVGKAIAGERRATTYTFVHYPQDDARALQRTLDDAAQALRARGYHVTLDVRPPATNSGPLSPRGGRS